MTAEALPSSSISWRQWFVKLLAWPWEVLLLVLFFGWLYRQTMPPGISSWMDQLWNPAVWQITGSTWGMPAAPGYPLYTILVNLFVHISGLIPGLIGTPVVWRVSFSSTVSSLLTLALLPFILHQLSRNRIMALMAAAVLGISLNFWQAAVVAQIYSFHVLIFALTFWLALYWDVRRQQRRWLVLLGVVLGAGVVHHGAAFILIPTVILWVALAKEKHNRLTHPTPSADRWMIVIRRWGLLASGMVIPLVSLLYLPWAAQRWSDRYVGPGWFSREWWGLMALPVGVSGWLNGIINLFWLEAEQIMVVGVLLGVVGLLTLRRALWLFGPPFVAMLLWGAALPTPQRDGLLLPLTLMLCLGMGLLLSLAIRMIVALAVKYIRFKDKTLHGNKWISTTLRLGLSVLVAGLLYIAYRPLAQANYNQVNLSDDWQAVDLVEEISAIAMAGTPLTIIGQDQTILPGVAYVQRILGLPVEPLSTTALQELSQSDSISLLRNRLEQDRRVLVGIATIDQNIIPWLSRVIEDGQILLAPTGHPFLWELLPRPMSNVLPEVEQWTLTPAGAFLDGQVSVIAYHQQLIRKRTGCFLRLTLFWRTEETQLTEDYFVAVQPLGGETVLDKNDHLALMRGYLPFSTLTPGEIVRDEVDMLVRQPAALPATNLVVNLYQVQGDQYPTFGEIILPIMVDAQGCSHMNNYR